MLTQNILKKERRKILQFVREKHVIQTGKIISFPMCLRHIQIKRPRSHLATQTRVKVQSPL